MKTEKSSSRNMKKEVLKVFPKQSGITGERPSMKNVSLWGGEVYMKSLLLKQLCNPSYSLLNADMQKLSPKNLLNA